MSLKNVFVEKFYRNWIILLVVLTLIAPIFGFLKDLVGSNEPLEHVGERLGFVEEFKFYAPFPDYTVPLISNQYFSGILAGLIGLIIVFFFSIAIGKILARKGGAS